MLLAANEKRILNVDNPSFDKSSQDVNHAVRELPSAIRLTGICSHPQRGDCEFEIIMSENGRMYYKKEWCDKQKRDGVIYNNEGFRTIELIIDESYGSWFESWHLFGHQGGWSLSPKGGEKKPAVCRRIWSSSSMLKLMEGADEEFQQMTELQGLKIPKTIRWKNDFSGATDNTFIYTVGKIEVLERPDADFFKKILEERFPTEKKKWPKRFRNDFSSSK